MAIEPILPRKYSAQIVKRQYARVAWLYDIWSRLTEDKALKRLLAAVEIEDGTQILEVAVGTGRLFADLVTRNPTGYNEGIDLSPVMLARARQRLDRSKAVSSYQLQEGSAYKLPFESASFDLLISTFLLDLLPVEDFPRVLGEFERVLHPGGKLAMAYFSQGLKRANHFWAWVAKHFPVLLTGCRPVVVEPSLRQLKFRILHHEEISQNTFPSAIVIVQKKK